MDRDSPSSPPSDPVSGVAKGQDPRWTNRKMVEFLRTLAATHSVKDAARAVGMSRQSAYRLRARLKGKAFDAAWDEAFHHSYGNLPYAALERALYGIEVPHFYKGELIGTSRRYDERLTVALLKLFNSHDVLIVGGESERQGRRLETLLGAIAARGEAARDLSDSTILLADSADVSPSSDSRFWAEFRHFDQGPHG